MPAKEVISHMLSDVWFDRLKVEEEEYKYQVYLQKQRVKPAKKTVTVVVGTLKFLSSYGVGDSKIQVIILILSIKN